MASTYITKQGEMVDEICWKVYGSGYMSMIGPVLAANPGLADIALDLPAGVTISLPDQPSQAPVSVQRLE